MLYIFDALDMLLRHALQENFGINKHIEFTDGDHGKPYLRDYPRIYFNISHNDTIARV
jgi:4'-phosphopantetheinyl transferase